MKIRILITVVGITVLSLISLSLAQEGAQLKQPQQRLLQAAVPHQAVPPIDPNMVRRIQGNVSRSAVLNTLMSNQAARSVLETHARNAKVHVNELASKGLDGRPISVVAQGKGNKLEDLNWKGGIRFSFVKDRPTYFDQDTKTEKLVGVINAKVHLYSNDLSWSYSYDYFTLSGPESPLQLAFALPPHVSTYMISIQASTLLYEVFVADSAGTKKLDIMPLGTGQGGVAITTISPMPSTKDCGWCLITLKPSQQLMFGGFTITRL